MEYRGQIDEKEYDMRLDNLVDKGMSYVEARAHLGPPPYEMATTAYDHIEESLGGMAIVAALDSRIISDDDAIALIDDPQHYLPFVPKSNQQAEIDRIGRAQVRQAMAA